VNTQVLVTQFFAGILFIVFGFAQLIGTFWQPLGRYVVNRSVFAEHNDQRERRRVWLGWTAQTLAFILIGINLVISRFSINNRWGLLIAVFAAVLAAIPIVYKPTNGKK
jgi:hypothetical protein